MQRIADILAKEHAQLWINHDAAQTSQFKHAPDYYEQRGRVGPRPSSAGSPGPARATD
jgi:hypothetical protein